MVSSKQPVSSPTAEYIAKSAKSGEMVKAFGGALAGGETRSTVYFEPYPIVVERGDGARLFDVDGNIYIDALNNYTSLVHGHAFPPAVRAMETALKEVGTAHAGPHISQYQLADLLTKRLPAERIRFTNSGTEANLLALRIARAVTGRNTVVGFEGGYHGGIAGFLEGAPDVVRVPFNDLEKLSGSVGASTAAIIGEPFLGSGGIVPAAPGFLQAAVEIAHNAGALFILDEVISLRNDFRGVHEALGLDVDLVTLGKIIGGGLPVGAVAGREALMAEAAVGLGGRVNHSGTFNGNVLTMVAGIAYMEGLDAKQILRLNRAAGILGARIESIGEELGLPLTVTVEGSVMQVHFQDSVPRTAELPSAEQRSLLKNLHLGLLLRGIYTAPRGMLNLSTAMADDDFESIGIAYKEALQVVKDGGDR